MADVELTAVRLGDPRTTIVRVVDSAGDAVPLDGGGTWSVQFRKNRASSTNLAVDSNGDPVTVDVSQAASGILSFVLTGEMTRSFGTGVVYGSLEGSAFGELPTFKLSVRQDVTRVVVDEAIVEPTGGLTETVTVTYDGTVSTAVETAIALVVSGDVSATGSPSATQYARWTNGTTIEGRTPAQVRSDLNVEDGATADQSAADIVGEFTGTPDGTQFLRDDGTLATPAGGTSTPGSWEVISSTVLASPAAAVTFSSISTDYDLLRVRAYRLRGDAGVVDGLRWLRMRFNGAASGYVATAVTAHIRPGRYAEAGTPGFSQFESVIDNPQTGQKVVHSRFLYTITSGGTAGTHAERWTNDVDKITSVELSTDAHSYDTGGIFILEGLQLP